MAQSEEPAKSEAQPADTQIVEMHAPPVRPHRAFSLVEVIIVVVIISIAAVLVVPMFSATNQSRLIAAAQLLAADLDFAKVESITHSDDPRTMVFDSSGAWYYIAAASDTDTPVTNPIGNLPYRTTFGNDRAAEMVGVTIVSTAVGDDDQLAFGAFGQIDQTTAAEITLGIGDYRITVSVDPASSEIAIGSITSI